MTKKAIRLSELLSFLICSEEIEIVEFYNNDMNFLYSFPIQEIPLETTKIRKFNLRKSDSGKYILEVIEI